MPLLHNSSHLIAMLWRFIKSLCKMTDSVSGKQPYWMCIHFHTCITFSHLKCFKVIKLYWSLGTCGNLPLKKIAIRRFSKFKISIVRSVTQLQAALLWNRPEAKDQEEIFSLREAWPRTSFSSGCSRKWRWSESSIVREGGGGRNGGHFLQHLGQWLLQD